MWRTLAIFITDFGYRILEELLIILVNRHLSNWLCACDQLYILPEQVSIMLLPSSIFGITTVV